MSTSSPSLTCACWVAPEGRTETSGCPVHGRAPTLSQDKAGTDILPEPDFQNDLIRGDEGAEHLRRVFAGAHQVKNDERALQTGNLYLELMHDPGVRGAWLPSGVLTCDAEFWSHRVGPVVHIFEMLALRAACVRLYHNHPQFIRTCSRGSCPTVGLCLPVGTLTAFVLEADVDMEAPTT